MELISVVPRRSSYATFVHVVHIKWLKGFLHYLAFDQSSLLHRFLLFVALKTQIFNFLLDRKRVTNEEMLRNKDVSSNVPEIKTVLQRSFSPVYGAWRDRRRRPEIMGPLSIPFPVTASLFLPLPFRCKALRAAPRRRVIIPWAATTKETHVPPVRNPPPRGPAI